MEVLPLDLYFNVQVGLTFSKITGDYNLELAESQVSLVFRLYKHAKLAGRVRNGGLTLLEKLPLCASWVKCSVKCGTYLKTKTVYLVFNCHSWTTEVCGDLFIYGEFPDNRETQWVGCRFKHSRPHLNHSDKWFIIAIYYNITHFFLQRDRGQSLLGHFSHNYREL